jgi:putative transposase
MKFQPNNFYHVFNRGNNRQIIFPRGENYSFFLKKVEKEVCPYCNVIAYCLMPNHYHLLIHSDKDGLGSSISGKMQILERKLGTLQSSYTRAINNQEKKTGSLFQPKLKVIELDEMHSAICFHYIHQNPVKAGLASSLEDWKFSSYNEYLNSSEDRICKKSVAYELLRISSQADKFIEQSRDVIVNEEVLLKLT